jgi:hypothetical protein
MIELKHRIAIFILIDEEKTNLYARGRGNVPPDIRGDQRQSGHRPLICMQNGGRPDMLCHRTFRTTGGSTVTANQNCMQDGGPPNTLERHARERLPR